MEIEAKFALPDEQALEALAGLSELDGHPLSVPVRRTMTDVYLDTPDRLIRAAGYTCRKRTSRRKTLVTVKRLQRTADGMHRREEHEVEVPSDASWKEWPEGVVRHLLAGLIGDRPLEEVLTLKQTRLARRVGPPRQGIAELSLDRVEIGGHKGVPGPESSQDKNVFYEVEVELKPRGTEEQLAGLASALKKQGDLGPQPLPKFEQALALLGEADAATPAADVTADATTRPELKVASGPEASSEQDAVPEPAPEVAPEPREAKHYLGNGRPVLKKPGISPDDTMADAASKTLLYHLQRMMRHEPGTREGKDPEELHDMRVAVRRMRAAVRVFGDYLDRGALKPYLKIMRQTGRQLGTVRDLDVFRIKVQDYLDSLPPGQESALDPLLVAWDEERERQRANLVSFLDDDRYEWFKEEFESFLRRADLGVARQVSDDGEPLPTKIRDVLPHVLLERLAAVRAYDESITSGSAPVMRFHQLRITTKSLRYNLEFFQEVLGPKSKSLIDITKLVQDHLGDLQDASVTCEVLLGFLASGTWGPARRKTVRTLPVNAPGVAAYLAVKQEEIESLMQTFQPVWRRIRGPQFSRRLATLVGAL